MIVENDFYKIQKQKTPIVKEFDKDFKYFKAFEDNIKVNLFIENLFL